MKKKFKILIVVLTVLVSMGALSESAGAAEEKSGYCPRPYGGYCRGPRWGWYGANRPVTTAEEARKNLEKYFEGRDLTIGTIIERRSFFEAEIRDKKGTVTDRVIIHKRTGRIRSVY